MRALHTTHIFVCHKMAGRPVVLHLVLLCWEGVVSINEFCVISSIRKLWVPRVLHQFNSVKSWLLPLIIVFLYFRFWRATYGSLFGTLENFCGFCISETGKGKVRSNARSRTLRSVVRLFCWFRSSGCGSGGCWLPSWGRRSIRRPWVTFWF